MIFNPLLAVLGKDEYPLLESFPSSGSVALAVLIVFIGIFPTYVHEKQHERNFTNFVERCCDACNQNIDMR